MKWRKIASRKEKDFKFFLKPIKSVNNEFSLTKGLNRLSSFQQIILDFILEISG